MALDKAHMSEFAAISGRLGLGIERDRFFIADNTLLEYASKAWAAGAI